MRTVMILILACVVSGCVTDVSQKSPHDKLVGTVWRLKTDAYVVRFNDQRNQRYVIPNTENFSAYLRDYSINGEPFDEGNIGRKIVGEELVGGLRLGETFKVVRVLKSSSIDMGTSYWPMMIPCKDNKWTGDDDLNGNKLYRGRDKNGNLFYEQGILNPEYAEIVSAVTNPLIRSVELETTPNNPTD
ncbi:MAG: hypothetical protein V5783_04905 [Pontiella sp.]